MPRKYKPKPLGKTCKKYPRDLIQQAVREYKDGVQTLGKTAKKFGINKSVLFRHSKRDMKAQGGPTALSKDMEESIVKIVNLCANRVERFGLFDLRLVVKKYLDESGITVKRFKDNMPGPDYAANFLNRHRNAILHKISRSVKKKKIKNNNIELKSDTVDSEKLKRYVYSEEITDAINIILEEMKNNFKVELERKDEIIVQAEESSFSCSEGYIEEYIEEYVEDITKSDKVSISENKNIKREIHNPSIIPCTHKSVHSKKYKTYLKDYIKQAVGEFKDGVGSLAVVAEKYGIHKSVLYRHSRRGMKTHGGQTVLSKEIEEDIVQFINFQSDYPLRMYDLRLLVKKYLDKSDIKIKQFRNNMPGSVFATGFLNRHKNDILQNIIPKRFSRNKTNDIAKIKMTDYSKKLNRLSNSDNEQEKKDTNKIYLELQETSSDSKENSESEKKIDNREDHNDMNEEYIQ